MHSGYGQWLLAVISIVLFGFFIKANFHPRNKVDWRSYQMILAFLIALFVEMYGFPLTIYLLTSFFGKQLGLDLTHDNGHILNTLLGLKGDPHFNWLHILSDVLIFGGIILLGSAWKILYQATKNNTLAMTGPYNYIRHPQYLGFILMIIGFLLQWPTLITLLMAPFLIVRYIRLARQEEKWAIKKFGERYENYRKVTPGFYPSLVRMRQRLTAPG